MARGQPDYDNPDLTIAVNKTDTGFLFPSLNGFSQVDSRGRIIWFDDFRDGIIRWVAENDAGGNSPYWYYQTPISYSPHGSILFDPVVSGGISTLRMESVLEFSNIMGIEASLYLPTNYATVDIYFQVAKADGTTKAAQVQITASTALVKIIHSGGTTTIVTPSNAGYMKNRWVVIKLVADFNNAVYKRLFVGNSLFDISAYSMAAGVAGFKGNLMLEVDVTAPDGTNKQPAYLGSVILTGDEP